MASADSLDGLACWTLVPASVSVEALEVGREGGRREGEAGEKGRKEGRFHLSGWPKGWAWGRWGWGFYLQLRGLCAGVQAALVGDGSGAGGEREQERG